MCIVDFGNTRRYVSPSGQPLDTTDPNYKATSRYSSLSCSSQVLGASLSPSLCGECKKVYFETTCQSTFGPKDDVWALFFVVLDLLVGSLPWKKDRLKNIDERVCMAL